MRGLARWAVARGRIAGKITARDHTTGFAFSAFVAIVSSFVSLRHVLPRINDDGYGSAALGLHTYTWAWITFTIAAPVSVAAVIHARELAPGTVTFALPSRITTTRERFPCGD
ncbi:hypothetical protein [Streptomyces sp. NPDC058157]|uniref:hypothetical protein n=1 Tax=Streptomyces sp. NPDC058157 TaxID=3346360 RepID=UPI0036E1F971